MASKLSYGGPSGRQAISNVTRLLSADPARRGPARRRYSRTRVCIYTAFHQPFAKLVRQFEAVRPPKVHLGHASRVPSTKCIFLVAFQQCHDAFESMSRLVRKTALMTVFRLW